MTTLNLSMNNIGDGGALAIAEMLKSNTTLESLDLSGNVIDYDGITAIAEALAENTALKVLHIRYGSGSKPCTSGMVLAQNPAHLVTLCLMLPYS